MNIARLLNQTCTITHTTTGEEKTAYGRRKRNSATTEARCTLQQIKREEEGVSDTSDTREMLWLLPDVTIGSGDTVALDGEEYEVEGEPEVMRNARTNQAQHIEATLRKVEGPAS
jgi:hypothetical protein